jgi:hypothetical protein
MKRGRRRKWRGGGRVGERGEGEGDNDNDVQCACMCESKYYLL